MPASRQHREQRLARHADALARVVTSVVLVDVRAAAVAVVEHERHFALAIGERNRHAHPLSPHGFAARWKRSRSRIPGCGSIASVRTSPARGEIERIEPDIRPDIDEGECAALAPHRLGQHAPLHGVEHLRREQRVLLAAVAARIEPQPHAPQCRVAAALADAAHDQAAKQDGEPQAEPVLRHGARQRQHRALIAARQMRAPGRGVE